MPTPTQPPTFQVRGHRTTFLNSKKSYTLQLDFQRWTLIRTETSKSATVNTKEFVLANFEKIKKGNDEHDLSVHCEIRIPRQSKASYSYAKQSFYFKTSAERDEFCGLIHAANRCGKQSLEAFRKLDTDNDGIVSRDEVLKGLPSWFNLLPAEDKIHFPQFMLHYFQIVSVTSSHSTDPHNQHVGQGFSSTSATLSKRPPAKSVVVKTWTGNIVNERNSVEDEDDMKLHVLQLVLIQGEMMFPYVPKQPTSILTNGMQAKGDLYLTNYRISFIPYDQTDQGNIDIPLMAIYSIERLSEKNAKFTVNTKNFRTITFSFDSAGSWFADFYDQLMASAFCDNQLECFAFVAPVDESPQKDSNNGWGLYDLQKEYQRMSLTDNANFRILHQKDYDLCDTYPSYLVVPITLKEEEIKMAAAFRSRNRLPVVTWKHPRTQALLCRCSQPLSG